MSAEAITMLKQLCDEHADLLAKARAAAAEFEVAAAGKQLEIEALASQLIEAKEEGQVTLNVCDAYDIKVSRTATRKANTDLISQDWSMLPNTVQAVFKFDASIKLPELRALNEGDARIAASYYSTSVSGPKWSISVRKQKAAK